MLGAHLGWSRRRTPEELDFVVRRQLGHLRRSAAAYDTGIYEEAERLSACVYILCSDGGKSRPLLGQAGLRRKLRLFDTSHGSVPGLPLAKIVVESDNQGRYEARYDWNNGSYPEVTFNDWWNQNIYFSNKDEYRITRRQLVKEMRNTDGGGHVDVKLDSIHYERLHAWTPKSFQIIGGKLMVVIHHNHGGRRAPDSPEVPHIGNGHWASMRQIAWELDDALSRAGYEDIPRHGGDVPA